MFSFLNSFVLYKIISNLQSPLYYLIFMTVVIEKALCEGAGGGRAASGIASIRSEGTDVESRG